MTSIGLLGDIYLDRTSSEDPFADVDLAGADYWFANLEAPLTDAGTDAKANRSWTENAFQIRPALVRSLRGLTAVSVANNHALDYGPDAYLSSLKLLGDSGVVPVGGGQDVTEARRPLVLRGDEQTVAFIAYTCLYQDGWAATRTRPGMATVRVHTTYEAPPRVFEQPGWPPIVRTFTDPADADELRREIGAARELADILVVSFHWGLSTGQRKVIEYQKELGFLAVDAGADAVFGHHPHTLQPLITHRGKPIFLSLGNIVFDYDKAWRDDPATVAVRLHFDAAGLHRVGILPLVRDAHSNPVRPEEDVARRIAARLVASPGFAALEHSWHEGECIVSFRG